MLVNPLWQEKEGEGSSDRIHAGMWNQVSEGHHQTFRRGSCSLCSQHMASFC